MPAEPLPPYWNALLASLPGAHLLQTSQWAGLKARVGWQPLTRIWGDPAQPAAAALILMRTIVLAGFAPKLRLLYLPKGPLLRDWSDSPLRQQVLADLIGLARQKGAIFLKIDPDLPLDSGLPGTLQGEADPVSAAVLRDLTARGFRESAEQIQFRNTVLLDLAASEEEILARMKQKTRYNLRLASRKGVTVRPGSAADLDLLYRMYAETSLRDGFTIRAKDYYFALWQTFLESGQEPSSTSQPGCLPLIAEVEGEPVAALVIFHFARRAYYLHGMSRTLHREKMPTYLLQWEAIRSARSLGCLVYDLWGAPDHFDESDPLWGVFRFKEGLGGRVSRTLGAYDLPLRPNYYRLYTRLLPRLLSLMRRRGNLSTKGALAN